MKLAARVLPESGGKGNFLISLNADGKSIGTVVVHSRDYADNGESVAQALATALNGLEIP